MIIGIASADYLRSDRSPTGQEVWGGSGWARVGQYVHHFRAAGHHVVCGTAWNENEKYLSVEDEHKQKVFPDVVVLQRLMHDGLAKTIKGARASGQVVINDLDDWYWGLSPSNEAFAASHPKINKIENTHHYGSILAASDYLTVSTPYLAERIAARVKAPIIVIPNYVDVSRFTPVVQSEEQPVVGWVGSTSHRSGDVEMLRGIIKPFVLAGDIRVHHSGASDRSPSFASQIGLGEALVSTTPRCVFADYPKLLHFDVGMVPLRDTPFNHAKSDIKGLEYAAAGIPFIASLSPSYKALHDRWSPDTGFYLAKRPDNWVRAIRTLLDYKARVECQAALLEKVKTRHIDFGVTQWLDLLEGVVDKGL